MNYGEKLKYLREYNDYSQREVAEALGIKRSSYNQFEQQYDIIPIKRLNQVANFYNVSVDYILNLTKNEKYENSLKDINIDVSKERLKELRKSKKITQREMANFLQTVQPTITNYEHGKNIISTPFLYAICKKFNISADYLLGKINNPKYLV